MVTTSVMKTKFSQINDKRFYFPNGILSLPYGHPSFTEISDFKTEKGQKIENQRWKKSTSNLPRLRIFDQVLNQEPKLVNLNQKSGFAFFYPRKVKKAIKDIVLSGEWMKQSIFMMGSSK